MSVCVSRCVSCVSCFFLSDHSCVVRLRGRGGSSRKKAPPGLQEVIFVARERRASGDGRQASGDGRQASSLPQRTVTF
jgi:hypothetical protein